MNPEFPERIYLVHGQGGCLIAGRDLDEAAAADGDEIAIYQLVETKTLKLTSELV